MAHMSDLNEAYDQGGTPAVLQALAETDTAEAVKAINRLVCSRYNDHKDLEAVRSLADEAERLAEGSQDPDVLSAFKAVCFNRAAFYWRGWGDGPQLDPEEEIASAKYADKNLELAIKLEKGPVPTSRAEWLVGAFKLSSGDPAAAGDWFARAFETGQSNEDELEKKMVKAYELVAKGQPGAAAILDEIDQSEDGGFYSGQVRSCAKVYGLQIK